MTDQADADGILATLAAEHNEVERALADPAVHADQARARTLGRRYAELSPIMAAARRGANGYRATCAPRWSLRRRMSPSPTRR